MCGNTPNDTLIFLQVVSKAEKVKKRKADEEFLERLEQVQLAEE